MIDKAKFKCSAIVAPKLVENPHQFLTDLDYATFDTDLKARTRQGSKQEGSLTITLLPKAAIRLFIAIGLNESLLKTVEFNPLKLIDGHNGNPNRDFRAALTELHLILSDLLANPEDADFVIPGLRDTGASYWTELEIPRQILNNKLHLSAFQAGRHESIQTTPAIYPGESVRFGRRDSDLLFNIYAKDKEMERLRKKFNAPEDQPQLLRLEVRFKGERLAAFLGRRICKPGNLRKIMEEDRLVRFTLEDCVEAHRLAFEGFLGVYSIDHETKGTQDKVARFIARLHRLHKHPIDGLMNVYRDTLGKWSDNTFYETRRAIEKELERTSIFSLADLLARHDSDVQPAISIPELESKARAMRRHRVIYPPIAKAYSSGKFEPHVDWI